MYRTENCFFSVALSVRWTSSVLPPRRKPILKVFLGEYLVTFNPSYNDNPWCAQSTLIKSILRYFLQKKNYFPMTYEIVQRLPPCWIHRFYIHTSIYLGHYATFNMINGTCIIFFRKYVYCNIYIHILIRKIISYMLCILIVDNQIHSL